MTQKRTDALGPDVYTVSDLTADIKHLLEQNFPFIWVNGEISNFSTPVSGHFYFALKDDKAQIAAVMFKGQHRRLEFTPEDGMSVMALGRLTVYEPRGTYQVIVEHMLPLGAGALYAAFEKLKKKLSAEGLFDDHWKKPLPLLPRTIKLITSPTGAARHDVTHVINRRFPGMPILHLPVQVQGEAAAAEIVSAISNADDSDTDDVIIIARGGGSFEDLAPFNTERVARAIFSCRTPVVTGIGHQTDFSIADMVADCRAPTPSAAAEIAVPQKSALQQEVATLKGALQAGILAIVQRCRSELQHFLKDLTHPKAQLQHKRMEIDHLSMRLTGAIQKHIALKQEKSAQYYKYLKTYKLDSYITIHKHKLEDKHTAVTHALRRLLGERKTDLLLLCARLKSADPTTVLKRGYSITMALPTRAVITEAGALSLGQEVNVMLRKGSFRAKVTEITLKNKFEPN